VLEVVAEAAVVAVAAVVAPDLPAGVGVAAVRRATAPLLLRASQHRS
jgi:hypothetical protein